MKENDKPKAASDEVMTQYAGLCYRQTKKRGTEVLLITSRDTGRWIIPKGWPMKGKSGFDCALIEAFEEAGVEGKPAEAPLGIYSYDKVMADGSSQPCIVTVFAINVARLRSNFPERNQRNRRWFRVQKAARKVAEPELRAILTDFAPIDQDGAAVGKS